MGYKDVVPEYGGLFNNCLFKQESQNRKRLKTGIGGVKGNIYPILEAHKSLSRLSNKMFLY